MRLTYGICGILVLALGSFYMVMKKNLQRRTNVLLCGLLVVMLLLCSEDVLFSFTFQDLLFGKTSNTLLFIDAGLNLFLMSIFSALIMSYMYALVKPVSRSKLVQKLLILLPVGCTCITLLFNSVVPVISISADGRGIHYGIGYYFLELLFLIYSLLSVFIVYWRRAQLQPAQRLFLIVLLSLIVGSALLDIIIGWHGMLDFMRCIALTGCIVAIEEPDVVYDFLTLTGSRMTLFRDMDYYMEHGQHVEAILVRVGRKSYLAARRLGRYYFSGLSRTMAEKMQQSVPEGAVYSCGNGTEVILHFGTKEDTARYLERLSSEIAEGCSFGDIDFLFPSDLVGMSVPEDVSGLTDFQEFTEVWNFREDSAVRILTFEELKEELRKSKERIIPASSEKEDTNAELGEMVDRFIQNARKLTPAERRLLNLYVEGYEINEIPEKAFISMNTVKKHNKSIYEKLEVSSKNEIMLYFEMVRRAGRHKEMYLYEKDIK